MNVIHTTPYGVFEWDSLKEAANRKKHGISFFDAVYAFCDGYRVMLFDEEHSEEEDRFLLIGSIRHSKIALVVFTDRHGKCRIISARLATRTEVSICKQPPPEGGGCLLISSRLFRLVCSADIIVGRQANHRNQNQGRLRV